ncbi:MAG: electron transfer flavoprotein subunit alpha/FixB family protein [Deltaproteobacteria bacterium]|jgi:electron transfer flavoprotein alpha subunit|nr:electron transfer flavoprotein subunit alpha/FixB family protein [Deltaproteobacteria bacterium]
MAGILIYSEKSRSAAELVSAAKSLDAAGTVHAVSINDDALAGDMAARGAHVHKINESRIRLADAASVAAAVGQTAEKVGASIVLLSSNRRGKELSGRLAHVLGAGCLTDVLSLKMNGAIMECVRNSFGGAALATQSVVTERQVIALSPKSFEPAPEGAGGSIEDTSASAVAAGLKLLESRSAAVDAVDLEAAEIIVAVGLGVDADDLKVAEKLSAVWGGALGCSKPVATDRKLLPEDRIIGLSGSKCKPGLALLMGISGQVQFMVGIREAGRIVSINTDENANTMRMADYRLVGRIKDILPELIRAAGA